MPGVGEDIIQNDRVKIRVAEWQLVHVAPAQAAIRQPGEHQFGAREAARVGIDIDTHGTVCPAGKQLENPAPAATDIKQISEMRRHGQFQECLVKRPVSRPFRPDVCPGIRYPFTPVFLQASEVVLKNRILIRDQFEQPASCCRLVTAHRHAIKDPLAVPKALQYPGVAEPFQVLRDPWLTQADDLCEFGNTTFALPA